MLPYSFKIDNLCSYLFVSSIQQIMQEKAKGVVQLDTFTKISEIRGFWDSIDTRELEFQFFVKRQNIISRSKKLRTVIPLVKANS